MRSPVDDLMRNSVDENFSWWEVQLMKSSVDERTSVDENFNS